MLGPLCQLSLPIRMRMLMQILPLWLFLPLALVQQSLAPLQTLQRKWFRHLRNAQVRYRSRAPLAGSVLAALVAAAWYRNPVAAPLGLLAPLGFLHSQRLRLLSIPKELFLSLIHI